MAKCLKCGRGNPFLRLDQHGLCPACASKGREDLEAQLASLRNELGQSKKEYADLDASITPEKNFDKTVEFVDAHEAEQYRESMQMGSR